MPELNEEDLKAAVKDALREWLDGEILTIRQMDAAWFAGNGCCWPDMGNACFAGVA